VAALLIGAALGTESGSASAQTDQVRIGSAPQLPSGAKLLAGAAAATSMQISLALVPQHAAELARYAREVSEPGSPRYRRYLTAAQFTRRFGASRATVTRVERSLRARGLRPQGLSANRLSLRIRASSAAVEHAFSLQLASYRLPDGRDVTLNLQAPAVDRRIAGSVQAVVGLSGLATMRPSLEHATGASSGTTVRSRTAHTARHVVTGGPQPCAAATAAATVQDAYTPDQIASAYDFSGLYQQGDLGAGVTIAVYELEPNLSTDIAAFQKCMGTDSSITYVPVDSGVGTGEGSGEAALDIEQLIAFAPDAKLLVYQGPNSNSDSPGSGPYDTFATIIGQDRAQVISNSWGECEAVEGKTDATAESTLFEEAALQGQTVVSASGDDGAQDCDSGGSNPNTSLAVDDPASQPFVTGVGGTALESLGDPPTTGLTETAWNDRDEPGVSTLGIEPGASGGGLSTIWPMPAYQRAAPSVLDVVQVNSVQNGCSAAAGYCRQVPDVSINADPATGYISYFNGSGKDHQAQTGWQGTGGTSSASPVWAALFALSDALPACGGSPIGFANPSLYALGGSSEATYFNDVATGGNDFTGTASGLFPAGVGYDMATGLGSPKAAALAAGLCGQVVHVSGPNSERMFVGSSVPANQRYTATPPAGADEAIGFSGSGLPAGVSIDQTTGLLSGQPTTAGVYRSHVAATTPGGAVGSMLVTWTVEGRPTVTNASLRTVTGQPQLALTVTSGRAEPGLRSVTLTLPSGVRLAHNVSGIEVRSGSGAKLHFTTTINDGVLTLTLRAASARIRVLLGPGTLVAEPSVRAEARQVTPPPLRLTVAAVDSSDASSTIGASVRPRA
jgi:subtilase family serine protease